MAAKLALRISQLLRVTSLRVCKTKTESPDFKVKVLNTASKKSKLQYFKCYSSYSQ